MPENFPQLMSDTEPQIQEEKRVLNRLNTPQTTPRHVIFTLQKIKYKEKTLQEAKGKSSYLRRKKEKNYI